jgi:hypothetical protein
MPWRIVREACQMTGGHGWIWSIVARSFLKHKIERQCWCGVNIKLHPQPELILPQSNTENIKFDDIIAKY